MHPPSGQHPRPRLGIVGGARLRPGTGGKRPGSGRKQGTPNKITAEIKELAHEYGPMAIKELARLAVKAESEAARLAAIKELPDRGYDKAMQPIQGTMEYGISEQLSELSKENADNTLGQGIARALLCHPASRALGRTRQHTMNGGLGPSVLCRCAHLVATVVSTISLREWEFGPVGSTMQSGSGSGMKRKCSGPSQSCLELVVLRTRI